MQKNWQKDKELECDLKKKCYSKQQNQRGVKQQETKTLNFLYSKARVLNSSMTSNTINKITWKWKTETEINSAKKNLSLCKYEIYIILLLCQ